MISGRLVSAEELAQHSDYLDGVLALYRRWYVEGDPVSTPEMAGHLLMPLAMLGELPADEDARVLVERLAVFAASAVQRIVCESSAGVAG